MTLLDAAERFASLDRSQVLLDTKHCLHSQDQFSDCAACFDVCPVEAITAGKPPSLDTGRCQSCLACLPACPAGAYRADDDVSSLLNCVTHVEDQSVELLCGLHPHPETGADPDGIGIQIHGCLAGLGTGSYVMLSALGLKRLSLRTEACSACKWCSLSPEIHRQAHYRRLQLEFRQQRPGYVSTLFHRLDKVYVRPRIAGLSRQTGKFRPRDSSSHQGSIERNVHKREFSESG